MIIPFLDLKAQYASIRDEIARAIQNVLDSTHFIQGEEVAQFETHFATYIGANHCVGVNSGTDALILGIKALGFPKNAEIIIPANTFIATALGASANGLKPVFVDIDESDFGIDLVDLRRKITDKTKAIIVVHLYGQPDKIAEIQKIIKTSGKEIALIEDACQAHGALYKDRRVGTYGIFSAFSFYPGKNLGAYGDGGALVTNDGDLALKIRKLREYGQKQKYYHEILGTNTRLDTIQAAILDVKLRHLDEWNARRQAIADMYTKNLQGVKGIQTPREYAKRKSVYHLYVIRTAHRDKLQEYLKTKGITTLIHYPFPLHLQNAYKKLGYTVGDLPASEKSANEILSLPIYPELTNEMVLYVADAIRQFSHL